MELIREGIRRKCFLAEIGPCDILNFGKYADASHAEWALCLDKLKMWTLKCFKFFLRKLLDLERAMEQEGELEETVIITRVEVTETLMEEMACEEMQVVEEYKEGTKQKVRWENVEDEHETREERSKDDQREWIKSKKR